MMLMLDAESWEATTALRCNEDSGIAKQRGLAAWKRKPLPAEGEDGESTYAGVEMLVWRSSNDREVVRGREREELWGETDLSISKQMKYEFV